MVYRPPPGGPEHPEWLKEAERGLRILDEGAEVMADLAAEGLPEPSEWEAARVVADADGWQIEIETGDGETFTHYTGVSSDDAAPDYIWDLYDWFLDYVDVEVEYETPYGG